jgi:uncharacterized protein (DUF1800 family)
MDRKDFFKATLNKRQLNKTDKKYAAFPPSSGLNNYAGNWTVNEVAHLLKRTMFGAKKQDIDYFLSKTINESVDELLGNTFSPAPPVRDYGLIEDKSGVFYDDPGVAKGATWVNDPNMLAVSQIRGNINQNRIDSLQKWWAGLIITQQRSIQEKMVLFWHHHFSVQKEEANNAAVLYKHHRLLRDNVLGNVKKLTRDVTIDPAMLIHLNGFLNAKQAPDENFARELQELFTIGRGNDSHFTEDDVFAAARVLTGWRYKTDPAVITWFDEGAHDNGSKSFSPFYNNTVIAGNNNGVTELDALIDMIFATTESARFICRKIYKWFVYYDIDDSVESNVIIPLAKILQDNNFEIKPVLAALFKSEHFFDAQNQACYIKSPFDLQVGTLREFDVPFPPYTDYVNGYPLFYNIFQNAADMQQELFQPPDVSGYAAYTQDPMNYELWVNSNSLPRYADFTNGLVKDKLIDAKAFAQYSSNPADPDQLVLDVTTLLLRYPLSAASKNYIKTKFLLNNTTVNSSWTNAWNSNNQSVINTALDGMFTFIMNLPEFHLC